MDRGLPPSLTAWLWAASPGSTHWTLSHRGCCSPAPGSEDLPFGLPREQVDTLRWLGNLDDSAAHPWKRLITQVRAQSRADLRAVFRQFCAGRPAGAKFAHRACDRIAASSPSMKWVNPPVAWMLYAAAPLLVDADVDLPGTAPGPAAGRQRRLPQCLALSAAGRLGQRTA